MIRMTRWLVFAVAVAYQVVLLAVIVGTVTLAIVSTSCGPVRVPCPPGVAEVAIHIYVAVLVLWGLVCLYLMRRWRRREGLKQHRMLARWFVLSLPVYGMLYLLRIESREDA